MAEILIVDDDELIRETLYELLSSNYSCDTAETADIALAKLADDSFNVVVTDISMPGLTGLELLERVVAQYPQTAVIIVSGNGDEEQAQELIAKGAFDSLLKPFRLEVVEDSVKRALEFQRKKMRIVSSE